jgi:hypothetical protein
MKPNYKIGYYSPSIASQYGTLFWKDDKNEEIEITTVGSPQESPPTNSDVKIVSTTLVSFSRQGNRHICKIQ